MTAVYVVRTTVQPGHDEEWLRWQDEEHIGNLLALPGYLGVQRFAEVGAAHSYLNVWRLADRSAQGTPEYRAASLTPWFERVRPFYDVQVDFSDEEPSTQDHGDAPWRSRVAGLVVDRAEPGPDAGGAPAWGPEHEDALAAAQDVVHVVRLRRLADTGPGSRSSASDVLLTHLAVAPGEARALPPAPTGVERRAYRPLTGYLATG